MPRDPGWGVRRTHLSQALFAAASALPNVRISDGRPIDRFEVTEDGVEVETAGKKLTCRFTGRRRRASFTGFAKQAGLAAAPAERRRFGIRRHYRIETGGASSSKSIPGAASRLTSRPVAPNRFGVAFLLEKSESALDGATAARTISMGMVEAFPRLQDRLSEAAPAGEPMASGPLEQRTRDCVADGVALIGDAAGYLDACTGEGITLALKQAVALEACLAPCLSQNSRLIRKPDLAAFRCEARKNHPALQTRYPPAHAGRQSPPAHGKIRLRSQATSRNVAPFSFFQHGRRPCLARIAERASFRSGSDPRLKIMSVRTENRKALDEPGSKRRLNRRIFSLIANRYPVATRALSFGRDAVWKRDMVAELPAEKPAICLDIATGTGDIARLLAGRFPGAQITGLDLTEEMLAVAREQDRESRIDCNPDLS